MSRRLWLFSPQVPPWPVVGLLSLLLHYDICSFAVTDLFVSAVNELQGE
jgi:hypothetical protein